MPLHGKIVVIKRSGGDGTEFPLTATCLFGRKPDCDIRIQLPQVSKEHCKIDLNENKEVILTNLSTTCPTRVNGEPLNQSERLKHGDMITIVDRSFRFEYPPAPTPKKRSSIAGKPETLKVLHDQQVSDTGVIEKGEKKISEVSTDPHLKDGANHDNIQRSLEKTVAVESKEDGSQMKSKTNSPFSDLYQMIKMSLDVKTPRKSSASQVQTPSSKFCTPIPSSVRKNNQKSFTVTPKKDEAKVISDPEGISGECPQSVKKQGELFKVPYTDVVGPTVEEAESATQTTLQRGRNSATSEKFTVSEIIEEISAQSPKSPMRRRSKEASPAKPAVTHEQKDQATVSPKMEGPSRVSPRNLEKVKGVSKKRKSGESGQDLLTPKKKKKRVSFGGYLSPELFDKRLPPDSPLRKGATPRRSLTLYKPKQSLLRRASVIGLLKGEKCAKIRIPSPKKPQSHNGATPETQPEKKLPKSRSPSPKPSSPVQMSPKSRSSSPKAASPAQKTPKSRSASPKAASPAQKTPKSRSASPKATSPEQKTPKSRSASPKAASPEQKTPKSRSASPKATSPEQKTPKSRSSSPKATSPEQKTPKSRSSSPKATSPEQKTPKSRSASPKATSPEQKTPKSRSASPKAASPEQKTPKSRSASPKAASPEQKTPKSRSASPKAASPARGPSPSANVVETPKANKQPKTQCKSTTPGQVSHNVTPSGKRRSSLEMAADVSLIGVTPAKTPSSSGVQTPTVQGRFSVSRISTPSPASEVDTVTNQEPSITLTPKINLKRRSIKSSLQKTPGAVKSASKNLQRKSGISRSSMKCSWADRVKFGQTKPQVVAPTKKIVNQKTKKVVPRPQTPARRFKDHMSTGHAESPVTIVVGRAHSRRVGHPTGAAPRLVTNTAVVKKDMKMDEDFTGVPEMFKTPANERKRKSLINECSTTKTPAGGLGTSIMETVLSTPEEPGEMIVSPLSVASMVKSRQYNNEAVQRLLNGGESSFVSDAPALEAHSESREQLCTDLKTPKQKTESPACLTGVKRIMKTPRQKAEPLEDIRGRLLKTPKQKPEQQECLTGVKRIMKTPRQKAEPLEDIRGKILLTPKQKPEQQECLTGVKRIFKTPKQKAEPLEDLRGKLLKTPKVQEVGNVSLDGVKELLKTPNNMGKSNKFETPEMKTENIKSTPMPCLTGVKRTMKTPKVKNSPVEDMVGLKRLMKTPKEKGKPVEENFGIQRLMKSPKLRGDASVEDFEGLKELLEEPLTDPPGKMEANEDEAQMSLDCDVPDAKDANGVVADEHSEVMSRCCNDDAAGTMETHSKGDADDSVPQQRLKLDENEPQVETSVDNVAEMNKTAKKPSNEKKSVRARRGKKVEADDKKEAPEPSEHLVAALPVRGRRGKKTEVVAPSVVRSTRGRNAKATDIRDVEPTMEESVPEPSKVVVKPKRGRNAKQAPGSQAEMDQEVGTEIETAPEPENEQTPPADVEHNTSKSGVAVEKPKRGRRAKQPEKSSQQQDVPCPPTEDGTQADRNDEKEACGDQPEVLPGETHENKSSEAMETALQTTESENVPNVETSACKVTEMKTAVVQKKSVRGRRAKVVETKETDHKQETEQELDEPVIPTPVRGRRGKKMEAVAPPAVKQTRTRNAKSQETTTDPPVVETQVITEISTEVVEPQVPPINTSPEKNASVPPTKSLRGRKIKSKVIPAEPALHQPEESELTSSEHHVANTQPEPQLPSPPAAGRPKRGRKTTSDAVEQNDVAGGTILAVQAKPPVRPKRGRSARLEEEGKMDDGKTTSQDTGSQEPVKKSRRPGKSEQDHIESKGEVQTVMIAPEAPHTELVMMTEQASVAVKPKRGGRKAKPDRVDAAEPKEVPVNSTDKPKQGRRGRRVTDEAATAENPKHKVELEEQKNAEPSVEITKPGRARGVKTSVKNEVSQAIPAKRARRDATLSLEKAPEKTTALKPESVPAPAEPVANEVMVSSDQTNLPEDSIKTVTEETKKSKRCVKWKADPEIFVIPKDTPVKAVRGRKAKPADQVDTKSKTVSKDANKTEEKDLSGDVSKAPPVKRGRRGAKDAGLTAQTENEGDHKHAEDEPQPKTRRGRSAKK